MTLSLYSYAAGPMPSTTNSVLPTCVVLPTTQPTAAEQVGFTLRHVYCWRTGS